MTFRIFEIEDNDYVLLAESQLNDRFCIGLAEYYEIIHQIVLESGQD